MRMVSRSGKRLFQRWEILCYAFSRGHSGGAGRELRPETLNSRLLEGSGSEGGHGAVQSAEGARGRVRRAAHLCLL